MQLRFAVHVVWSRVPELWTLGRMTDMHPLNEKYWSKREYWKWWGYSCPDDPRSIVPKHPRWAGYTINFGQRRSFPVFVLLVLLGLLPVMACAILAPHDRALGLVSLAIGIAALWAVCYRMANPRKWKEE